MRNRHVPPSLKSRLLATPSGHVTWNSPLWGRARPVGGERRPTHDTDTDGRSYIVIYATGRPGLDDVSVGTFLSVSRRFSLESVPAWCHQTRAKTNGAGKIIVRSLHARFRWTEIRERVPNTEPRRVRIICTRWEGGVPGSDFQLSR